MRDFSALRAEVRSARRLSDDDLIAGFVREAKLCDPKVATTFPARQVHVLAACAHASEIARRNEIPRLLPLLDATDYWLAYCVAERLSRYEGLEKTTLGALDRLVAASAGGAVTKLADYSRNFIRYGDFRPRLDA